MQLIQTKLISIEAKYANGARKPSFNSTLPFQPSNIQDTQTFKTTLSQNFPMNCHLIQLTRYSTDSKQITCARRLALICRCVGGRTRPWVWQRVTVLLTHGLTRWVAAWIIYRKRKYSSHRVLYFVILKSQTPHNHINIEVTVIRISECNPLSLQITPHKIAIKTRQQADC